MTRARYLALAAIVFAIDQVTKWAAVATLLDRPPLEVVGGVRLVLVYNYGAAFGFLNRAGGWQTAMFVVIALAVAVFIIVRLGRAAVDGPQLALAYALILAGAVGNVADRLRFGYVIDFIDVYYGHWHWPAFNVADAAITVGAVLLVMDALGWRLFGRRKPLP